MSFERYEPKRGRPRKTPPAACVGSNKQDDHNWHQLTKVRVLLYNGPNGPEVRSTREVCVGCGTYLIREDKNRE